ncbi:MAG: copper resistance protein NlpE [Bacteroidales bacterium]
MKGIYFCMVSFGLILLSASCKPKTASTESKENNQAEVQVSDQHTAQTSLDYPGIYEGTIPAADCPGIKVTLILNKDKTYQMTNDYIDRKDASYTDKGAYTIDGNYVTLDHKDGAPQYLKVEEGQIRMLDAEKQVIPGEMGNHYILKQTKVF